MGKNLAGMQQYGKCRLCLKPGKLRHSHIVPQFMLDAIEKDGVAISLMHGDHPRRLRKGHRDYLLCGDCETQRSVYEGRYKDTVSKDAPKVVGTPHSRIVHGIDAEAIRTVALSVQFLAHHSVVPFYEAVDLGDDAEPLRRVLLGEAVEGFTTRVVAFSYSLFGDPESSRRGMISPVPVELLGATVYRYTFDGALWLIATTMNESISAMPDSFADGIMTIYDDAEGIMGRKLLDEILVINNARRLPGQRPLGS